jgi:DNA-binding transcriptional LysR family regulator
MELDDLRCFVAAAERLSFRAAARVVARSPGAFSDRIRRLEDELGALLFDRTSRRVRLTAAGQRLLPHARRALAEAAAARDAVGATGTERVTLTLGTRYELGLGWVLPAVREVEAEHPSWTVHLLFGDTPALLAALRAGEADAVVGSMRLVDPGLATRPLCEEAYTFVGAPDLLDAAPLEGPTDAFRHTLVDISADLPLFRYWRDRVPPEQAWSFAAIRHLGTIAAVRAWVVAGGGVAVLPAYFVREDLEAGRLREVLSATSAASDWFRLVWRAGHPAEDALVRVAQVLRARPLA